METIEEQSKSETSNSSSPSPDNLRICLVGDAVSDSATVEAAHTFGVPVIISETGLEIINDYEWRTYFILSEFEGVSYETIHRSKQCILGPPALKHAAERRDGLTHNARPLYNYSMRGVVTCFTGIRKKDELTRLVNLIHSMGGCIRKDMNSKITHLISNHSGGDKYQYAKTFRLIVVRPAWVYAAWQRRDELEFRATSDDFSRDHKLRAFEGQKICFFGFPAEEHEHMVDVLKINGGVPAELDDPECSHVVMPNTGGYFPETLSNSSNSPNKLNTPPTNNPSNDPVDMEVDAEAGTESTDVTKTVAAEVLRVDNKDEILAEYAFAQNQDNNVDGDDDDEDHFDARLVVDYECNRNAAQDQEDLSPLSDDLDDEENVAHASTPKQIKHDVSTKSQKCPDIDGIVLVEAEEVSFQNTNNISPILSTPRSAKFTVPDIYTQVPQMRKFNTDIMTMETDDSPEQTVNEATDEDDAQFLLDELKDLKRKRESFDSVSLASVDSFALPTSTKKPKLIRTGSITRSIKRSMSFVAVRTPIVKMLRPRRSSVALDTASNFGGNDTAYGGADDSFCSIASIESTFNESIRKPVKEKLRSIRERITRSSSKKEKYPLNVLKTPEKNAADTELNNTDTGGFKTPKAPAKFSLSAAAAKVLTPKSAKSTTPQSRAGEPAPQTNTVVGALHTVATSTFLATSNTAISTITTNNSSALAVATSVFPTQPSPCNQATNVHIANNAEMQSMQCQDEWPTNVGGTSSYAPPHKCDNSQHTAGRTNTVVDEHTTQAKPEPKNNRTHILKSDWFWYTIQNGYADEMDYLFGDYLDSIANTPNTDRRDSLPISFNKRKRKRFSQRLQLEGTPLGSGKRRSSVSDAGLLSVSGSFFDCTTSPDKLESNKLHNEPDTPTSELTPVKKSMRFNHFMDFYSTESNYVGILDTIVNLFKNPLEELAECNDALLNKSEIKAIFGNFLPIHEVHRRMLERLRGIHGKWSEDCLIGDIILQYRDDLIKAYPPYVNFFEQMKEALQQCDSQNPRFHAFLKINQTKPECGRQSLQDLMIRPVQRLPSVSLLLNDILKHTNKSNPDYNRLEQALKAIKQVMMHINEDKRKTESRMAIFDIFNDIEGCPPHLVSSNRSFISKCEVTELSDNLSSRGDALMLYLFSDTIEVCKRRSRGFNTAKSPSSTKSHKHVKLMSLNAIRFVVDITDSPRAFALLCRQDKDKLHSFTISDEEIDKFVYLKTLCKQMAENACRTDTDKSLLFRTSQELEVDISDVNLSTLSKAFKLAARTRLKVGRAFSFNKTPSKLKRAVSTMMTSPFGSTNSLTPATQLAQMRLASCTNIHEVADEEGSRSSSPSTQSEVLVSPLSVQPPRKHKTSTLTSMVGRI